MTDVSLINLACIAGALWRRLAAHVAPVAIAAMLAMLPAAALAQAPPEGRGCARCGPREAVEACLAEKWGERRIAYGRDVRGPFVFLLLNRETGTWTFLAHEELARDLAANFDRMTLGRFIAGELMDAARGFERVAAFERQCSAEDEALRAELRRQRKRRAAEALLKAAMRAAKDETTATGAGE